MTNSSGFDFEARRAEETAQRAAAAREIEDSIEELSEIFRSVATDLVRLGVKPTPLGTLQRVTVAEQKIRFDSGKRKVQMQQLVSKQALGVGWTLSPRRFDFSGRRYSLGVGPSEDGSWYANAGLVLTPEGLLAWSVGKQRWSGTRTLGPVVDRSVPMTGYLAAGPAGVGHWLKQPQGKVFEVTWGGGPEIYRWRRDSEFRVRVPVTNNDPREHGLGDWLFESVSNLKECHPDWR